MNVSVLGEDYRVSLVPGDEGECDCDTKEITIGEKSHIARTLLHEVIHAALHESGWSHMLDTMPGDCEEGLARVLELGIWQSGIINKEVVNKLSTQKRRKGRRRSEEGR